MFWLVERLLTPIVLDAWKCLGCLSLFLNHYCVHTLHMMACIQWMMFSVVFVPFMKKPPINPEVLGGF
jgi:hypothetical protein